MRLDPNSSVPLFQQIAAYIRGAVAAGLHRPGEPVPSVRVLALDLTVNPNTVQRAYETLEREGLIESRKGLGMYVTRNGADSARRQTESAVRQSFDRAIREGRSANMSATDLQATFDTALSNADGQPGDKP